MTWGNNSWGHATSTDLLDWTEQHIALEVRKDQNGYFEEYFYSGSAVVDTENTSGFGTRAHPALVAIYTSHYAQKMTLQSNKTVLSGQESQSTAYSLDGGMTWITYDAKIQLSMSHPKNTLLQIRFRTFEIHLSFGTPLRSIGL
jgi:sucrose-6-phosphate hydrolase SacC (GH32 family)